jgi:hypothetical protein
LLSFSHDGDYAAAIATAWLGTDGFRQDNGMHS